MKNSTNFKWRFLYRLHRYLGLLSSLVLIILAITGIALNHTEELQLDSQMIQSSTILDWYGIKSSAEITSYATGHHWLTQINKQIYIDQSLLLKSEQHLLGSIETDEFIVAAFNDSLLLLSLQGDLIEQVSTKGVLKIGLHPQQQNRVFIATHQGILYSDDALISWNPFTSNKIAWSKKASLPDTIAKQINKSHRSSILPLERVILDLHSGRFFGFVGVLLVDLSALFLIILALSGCSIWLKHKLRHW